VIPYFDIDDIIAEIIAQNPERVNDLAPSQGEAPSKMDETFGVQPNLQATYDPATGTLTTPFGQVTVPPFTVPQFVDQETVNRLLRSLEDIARRTTEVSQRTFTPPEVHPVAGALANLASALGAPYATTGYYGEVDRMTKEAEERFWREQLQQMTGLQQEAEIYKNLMGVFASLLPEQARLRLLAQTATTDAVLRSASQAFSEWQFFKNYEATLRELGLREDQIRLLERELDTKRQMFGLQAIFERPELTPYIAEAFGLPWDKGALKDITDALRNRRYEEFAEKLLAISPQFGDSMLRVGIVQMAMDYIPEGDERVAKARKTLRDYAEKEAKNLNEIQRAQLDLMRSQMEQNRAQAFYHRQMPGVHLTGTILDFVAKILPSVIAERGQEGVVAWEFFGKRAQYYDSLFKSFLEEFKNITDKGVKSDLAGSMALLRLLADAGNTLTFAVNAQEGRKWANERLGKIEEFLKNQESQETLKNAYHYLVKNFGLYQNTLRLDDLTRNEGLRARFWFAMRELRDMLRIAGSQGEAPRLDPQSQFLNSIQSLLDDSNLNIPQNVKETVNKVIQGIIQPPPLTAQPGAPGGTPKLPPGYEVVPRPNQQGRKIGGGIVGG
jgi:hypothetical protein